MGVSNPAISEISMSQIKNFYISHTIWQAQQ